MKTYLTGTALAALLVASPARADDPAPRPSHPTATEVHARDQDRERLRDPAHDPAQAGPGDQMRDRLHDAAQAGAGDQTRDRLHQQMHDAMLEHAPVATGRPELPGRALADTMRAHAGEQREAAATRAAERHALRHRGEAAGEHEHGAGRPGMVPGGGMRDGAGPGAGGECGDAAGARRMIDMHGGDMGGGGHGGMDGTGGHGSMDGSGGTGTGTGGTGTMGGMR